MQSTHEVEHQELLSIIRWIDHNLTGLRLPTDPRSQIAAGCLTLVIENQAAIALLYQAGLYGSMMSLMRVLNEALVRGLWILHCADGKQVQDFQKGKSLKHFGDLISDIESASGGHTLLSRLKNSMWDAYNDFTHVGFGHVTRRHKEAQVTANYPDLELRHSQYTASTLGLLAASSLTAMSNAPELSDKLHARTIAFMSRRSPSPETR